MIRRESPRRRCPAPCRRYRRWRLVAHVARAGAAKAPRTCRRPGDGAVFRLEEPCAIGRPRHLLRSHAEPTSSAARRASSPCPVNMRRDDARAHLHRPASPLSANDIHAEYNRRMTEARRGPEPPDLSEKGGMKDGLPQRSNVRLFMQFMAFGGCSSASTLGDTLAARRFPACSMKMSTIRAALDS